MSKSAVEINYELRPCKFVERRMLLASLSRILGAIKKDNDYQYIGFGGCSFTDFKLFHKELHINQMISIENGNYSDYKLQLNKPFQCIKILRGNSSSVLPTLDLSIPSLIWLDYDGVLQKYMFEDIEIIFHTVPPGSVFILSCNRELKKGNYEELEASEDSRNEPMSPDEIKAVFGDLVPFDIESNACTPEISHNTIKRMLDKKIQSTISDRNLSKDENNKFNLLYNIIYQEGKRAARMFTYGGIICNDSINIDSIDFDSFDFITTEANPNTYRIKVPILTSREALLLNQILFDEDQEKQMLENKLLTEDELSEYKKIYKYCPSFHDVRM